jgi:hypothetical protein
MRRVERGITVTRIRSSGGSGISGGWWVMLLFSVRFFLGWFPLLLLWLQIVVYCV